MTPQASTRRTGQAARLLMLATLSLSACSSLQHGAPPIAAETASAPVMPQVSRLHAQVAAAADLSDPASYADAQRGFIAAPTGQIKDAQGKVLWDFESFRFVAGEAPPTVNPSLWRQAKLNNQAGLYQVSPGIWQVRGFDLANLTIIQGKTGWIMVDALTSRETAAAALAFARQHLGQHAVSAVIFTHSHIDHFGGVLGLISAQEAQDRHVPIVAPEGFMEEATSENVLMGTAMVRRAAYMYGSLLPRDAGGLVDTGLGKAVAQGQVGILTPTVLIKQAREEHVIDGVRFVFHNVPGSEAPSEFVFELPDQHAFCGAELMSQTLHNLYTLRGAKVRDALKWGNYLDEALSQTAQSNVLFNQHHWPVWGQARIHDFIVKQRDTYLYIHDQTVRMMNAGLNAAEIAEQLTLPQPLQDHLNVRGYYGTVRHNVKAVYQYYLGWFDANPANLDPLPPVEAARRYVKLAGGMAPLMQQAQQAFDAGDFRWSAELLKHAVYADPDNQAARALQARSFEQLGYMAESAPWRNFYLTGAQELRQGPPQQGMSKTTLMAMLQHTPTERFLDAMAASLNGPKAGNSTLKINLVFSDVDESHVLQIENGVLHHHRTPPAADANATLTLSKAFFLKMVTGQVGAKDLLLSDQTRIGGSVLDLGRFFGLIDKATGTFPIVTREGL